MVDLPTDLDLRCCVTIFLNIFVRPVHWNSPCSYLCLYGSAYLRLDITVVGRGQDHSFHTSKPVVSRIHCEDNLSEMSSQAVVKCISISFLLQYYLTSYILRCDAMFSIFFIKYKYS